MHELKEMTKKVSAFSEIRSLGMHIKATDQINTVN